MGLRTVFLSGNLFSYCVQALVKVSVPMNRLLNRLPTRDSFQRLLSGLGINVLGLARLTGLVTPTRAAGVRNLEYQMA